jgi:hypothetical protein
MLGIGASVVHRHPDHPILMIMLGLQDTPDTSDRDRHATAHLTVLIGPHSTVMATGDALPRSGPTMAAFLPIATHSVTL